MDNIINLTPTEKQSEFVLRTGTAEVIRQDEPIVLRGDFKTIDRYLQNRYTENQLINPEIVGKECNCIFDYEQREIRLYVKEEKYMRQTSIGKPSFSTQLMWSTLPFLKFNEKGGLINRFKIGFEAFRDIIIMNKQNISDDYDAILKNISNPEIKSETSKLFGDIKNFMKRVFIGSAVNEINFKMPLFNNNWDEKEEVFTYKISINFEFGNKFKGNIDDSLELPDIYVDISDLNIILINEIKEQIDSEFKTVSEKYPKLLTYKN